MREVEPKVSIIGYTMADDDAIAVYLEKAGAGEYYGEHQPFENAEDIVEFAGRMCYRSWQPGLNPNVTKVRHGQREYLENILKSGHGSVLEHVTWTFLLEDISRVLTHELVRHRPGTAISQESMRYVRLADIPVWLPDWAVADRELMQHIKWMTDHMEEFQRWMAFHFDLDDATDFGYKKEKTSFMRRFAPEGVATSMTWTANARALRHIIETRTSPGAEEEIRLVFGKVAELMIKASPMLFGDFKKTPEGAWVPSWSKV